MEIETMVLNNGNKVMQAYNHDEQFIHTFFDYKDDTSSYYERMSELAGRPFLRKELSSVIRSFMEPFGISKKASAHLEELSDNGVAVIGGQQAGIMTGPLYSIHKAITVILLAEEKRKELSAFYLPFMSIMGATGHSQLPLFEGRNPADQKTRIYVCFNKTCQLPVETTQAAVEQLSSN